MHSTTSSVPKVSTIVRFAGGWLRSHLHGRQAGGSRSAGGFAVWAALARPVRIPLFLAAGLGLAACSSGAGAMPVAPLAGLGQNRPVTHIVERGWTLSPLPFVRFCDHHPGECASTGQANASLPLNADTYATLQAVNRQVNAEIAPMAKTTNPVYATWEIAPRAGNCNDYAVTKRHELLARGVPSSALRLAAVRTSWGEGHLVLVVRTNAGELVLDSLRRDIRPWDRTGYAWVAVQSARNPAYWATVGPGRATTRMASREVDVAQPVSDAPDIGVDY